MRSGLNLDQIDLYAGIADARLQVDELHFGRGIALSRTFAHLSAPFLAGFLPGRPGISGMPLCSSPRASTSWRSSIFPRTPLPWRGWTGWEDLHKAVRNFDRSCFAPTPADALQLLWASLASLFLPSDDDGNRLASNLATFLEIPSAERAAFLDGTSDLLDARLASLEGAIGDLEEPVARTCGLVRQTLTRIFDNGFVPTLRELEAGLQAH
jgi:hypothetical protein